MLSRGIPPRTWYEKKQARRSTLVNGGIWLGLLIARAVLLWPGNGLRPPARNQGAPKAHRRAAPVRPPGGRFCTGTMQSYRQRCAAP